MYKKSEMSPEFNLPKIAIPEETDKEYKLKESTSSSGIEFIKQIIEDLIAEIREKNEIQEEAQRILDQVKELIRTEQMSLAQQRLAEGVEAGSEIQEELAEYTVKNPAILDNTRDRVGDIIGLIRQIFGQKTAGKIANIAVYLNFFIFQPRTIISNYSQLE